MYARDIIFLIFGNQNYCLTRLIVNTFGEHVTEEARLQGGQKTPESDSGPACPSLAYFATTGPLRAPGAAGFLAIGLSPKRVSPIPYLSRTRCPLPRESSGFG